MRIQILPTSEWINDFSRQWMASHCIDCEVSAQQVILQHRSKTHFWFARIRIVSLTAKSSDLDDVVCIVKTHCSKTFPDQDDRLRVSGCNDALYFIRCRICCQV